jgi:hypothetical protein
MDGDDLGQHLAVFEIVRRLYSRSWTKPCERPVVPVDVVGPWDKRFAQCVVDAQQRLVTAILIGRYREPTEETFTALVKALLDSTEEAPILTRFHQSAVGVAELVRKGNATLHELDLRIEPRPFHRDLALIIVAREQVNKRLTWNASQISCLQLLISGLLVETVVDGLNAAGGSGQQFLQRRDRD